MFRIILGRGFHITFENGYTISVQFGWGNYCENYEEPVSIHEKDYNSRLGKKGSRDAEIAILKPNRELLDIEEWEDSPVKGYCPPEEVLKWINYTAALPKENKEPKDA